MSRAHRYRDIQQSSFSNLSATSFTSQLILQPFCHFTYVTTHSPTLPSLYLELILQHFHHFTYVTAHSPTLLSLLLCHMLFPYGTWRVAHVEKWGFICMLNDTVISSIKEEKVHDSNPSIGQSCMCIVKKLLVR